MAHFDDLYDWVDTEESGYIHLVHAAFSVVYDKANVEASERPSTDFSACAQGVFSQQGDILEATFSVVFSDRIRISSGGSSTTGQRNTWRVRLFRSGEIGILQTGWNSRFVSLENVQRLDTDGAQFLVGHLSSGRTRALLSFSFDKVKERGLI